MRNWQHGFSLYINSSHSITLHPSILIQLHEVCQTLGAYIDENLSWKTHIDHLSKKIASGLQRRIRSFVPPASLHPVFNSLVQPHLNYCSVVWSNCNITLSITLQKLQNKAARIMTFSSVNSNVDDSFVKLGWRKLSAQRQLHSLPGS